MGERVIIGERIMVIVDGCCGAGGQSWVKSQPSQPSLLRQRLVRRDASDARSEGSTMSMHRRRMRGVIALVAWAAKPAPSFRKAAAATRCHRSVHGVVHHFAALHARAALRQGVQRGGQLGPRAEQQCAHALFGTDVARQATARAKAPDKVLTRERPAHAVRVDAAALPAAATPCVDEAARLAAGEHERGRQGVRLDKPAMVVRRGGGGCRTMVVPLLVVLAEKDRADGVEGDKRGEQGDEFAERGFARVELGKAVALVSAAAVHGARGGAAAAARRRLVRGPSRRAAVRGAGAGPRAAAAAAAVAKDARGGEAFVRPAAILGAAAGGGRAGIIVLWVDRGARRGGRRGGRGRGGGAGGGKHRGRARVEAAACLRSWLPPLPRRPRRRSLRRLRPMRNGATPVRDERAERSQGQLGPRAVRRALDKGLHDGVHDGGHDLLPAAAAARDRDSRQRRGRRAVAAAPEHGALALRARGLAQRAVVHDARNGAVAPRAHVGARRDARRRSARAHDHKLGQPGDAHALGRHRRRRQRFAPPARGGGGGGACRGIIMYMPAGMVQRLPFRRVQAVVRGLARAQPNGLGGAR
jgi:hypothetical protein